MQDEKKAISTGSLEEGVNPNNHNDNDDGGSSLWNNQVNEYETKKQRDVMQKEPKDSQGKEKTKHTTNNNINKNSSSSKAKKTAALTITTTATSTVTTTMATTTTSCLGMRSFLILLQIIALLAEKKPNFLEEEMVRSLRCLYLFHGGTQRFNITKKQSIRRYDACLVGCHAMPCHAIPCPVLSCPVVHMVC